MKYEIEYGGYHLHWCRWSSGEDPRPQLDEAVKEAVRKQAKRHAFRKLEVSALTPAKFEDVVCMDRLVEWMNEWARERCHWIAEDEPALDVWTEDWERVEALMREVVEPRGYVTAATLELHIDWENGDPVQGTVRLVEGEEERLAAWMKEIEAKGEGDDGSVPH